MGVLVCLASLVLKFGHGSHLTMPVTSNYIQRMVMCTL